MKNKTVVFIFLMTLNIGSIIIDYRWYSFTLLFLVAVWWISFIFSKKYQVWQEKQFHFPKILKYDNKRNRI